MNTNEVLDQVLKLLEEIQTYEVLESIQGEDKPTLSERVEEFLYLFGDNDEN